MWQLGTMLLIAVAPSQMLPAATKFRNRLDA